MVLYHTIEIQQWNTDTETKGRSIWVRTVFEEEEIDRLLFLLTKHVTYAQVFEKLLSESYNTVRYRWLGTDRESGQCIDYYLRRIDQEENERKYTVDK